MNKAIWIILICGMLQLSAAANVSMNVTPEAGLGELVAINYAVSSDDNITSCYVYNPYAVMQDSQWYWSMPQSSSSIEGKAVFKKDDANPIVFKCVTADMTYTSRDVVVTPLRVVDGLQLVLLILGMLICIFLCFTRVELIWGVGAGAIFLIYSKLCEYSFIDYIPTYAMMNGILKIGLGLVFVLLLFRFLNDDLIAILKGPGKKVGEGAEE